MSVKRWWVALSYGGDYDMVDTVERPNPFPEDGDYVLATDYDALTASLLIERGKLEKADAENDRLTARVAELEKALHEFGEHTDGCAVYEPGNKPCDCGYIKAKIGAAPADAGSES